MNIEVGKVVQGKITGIQPYGVFVRLSDECSGLIHVSSMPNDINQKQGELFKVSWIINVEILALNEDKSQAKLRLYKPSKESFFREGKSSKQPLGNEYNNGFAPLARAMPVWIKDTLSNQRRKK